MSYPGGDQNVLGDWNRYAQEHKLNTFTDTAALDPYAFASPDIYPLRRRRQSTVTDSNGSSFSLSSTLPVFAGIVIGLLVALCLYVYVIRKRRQGEARLRNVDDRTLELVPTEADEVIVVEDTDTKGGNLLSFASRPTSRRNSAASPIAVASPILQPLSEEQHLAVLQEWQQRLEYL
jgi:hypothetical protein